MRALFYECFSGISGDMHLGAMVDLGVDESLLHEALGRLPISNEFDLQFRRGEKRGIAGTQATVHLSSDHPRPHRTLATISAIIRDAGYDEPVEAMAVGMFTALAEAEARVHGTTPQDIHFHEVVPPMPLSTSSAPPSASTRCRWTRSSAARLNWAAERCAANTD